MYRTGCTIGQDCCGTGSKFAVYENKDFHGCYVPPIPGTQIGESIYPTYCFRPFDGDVPALPAGELPTRAVYNGPVIATVVPEAPFREASSDFTFLGCYNANQFNQGVLDLVKLESIIMTVTGCVLRCSLGINRRKFAALTRGK